MKDEYSIAFNEAVSDFLIDLRQKSRRTYSDVAYFLNLKPGTYYSYENGTRDIPIKVLKDVCRFHNVDFYESFRSIDKAAEAKLKKR